MTAELLYHHNWLIADKLYVLLQLNGRQLYQCLWLRVVVEYLLAGVLLSFVVDVTLSTSLFMFHLISFSPHFIDHVSLLFPSVHSPSHSFHLSQSILFIITLFGCINITWSFNHIVSFTFQPIPSLGISDLRVSLDKFLILDRYSLLEAELRLFYYSLSLYIEQEIQQWIVAWIFFLFIYLIFI